MSFDAVGDSATKRVLDRSIFFVSAPGTAEDLHKIGLAAVAEIKSLMQNEGHVITGETLGSVDIYEENSQFVSVGSDKESAVFLEFGRGPVEPVTAKVLHFKTRDGEDVFTMRVGPAEPTGVFQRGVLAGVEKAVNAIAKEKEAQLQGDAGA